MIGDTEKALYQRTLEIKERAYAPYSKFLVGVVLRARDGTLIEGVNVENGAYPLGACGEKTAYCTAVTMGYKPGDFDLIVINASPCGGRRPWGTEFQGPRRIFGDNYGEPGGSAGPGPRAA